MSATIETRKLSIIEHLAELDDVSILLQIENLLNPNADLWDELSDKDKATIRKGEAELNAGKRVAFADFLAQRRYQG